MKKPSKVIAKRAAGSSKLMSQAVNPLDVVREYYSYRKVAEQQKTERYKIKAERDKAVKAIISEKAIILEYFDLRFKERKETIDHFFETLDYGAESKDYELVDKALIGILGVIKDNPLKDFDLFRRQRLEGGTIEI